VPLFYTPPDTSIARQQLERLRAALAYISSVRSDDFATQDEKLTDLAALEDIHIDQETAQQILALSESRWQAVQQEAIGVLEQVMRSSIREDRLDETRRSVPTYISLSFPEDQAAIVADLVTGFVAPNSFFSESLTDAARQQARDAIAPITRTFMPGETIVQRGQVITDTDAEALEQFGLAQPETRWQDFIGAATLSLLVALFSFLYLRRNPALARDSRGLGIIALLFLAFLVAGRLILPDQAVVPYIFPAAAFSLIVASLFGARTALIFSLPLAILLTYDFPNALDLTLFYLFTSFVGVLTLGPARRITAFFWAGAAITLSGSAVVIAFRLPEPNTDWLALATLIGLALINGIASASLALLLQYFLAQFLGTTTALQLMEVSRPDHPLLQYILRNAPGTYQHSLQVANLAEQAADQISADTLLTRVGALYHDAGKVINPFYFIENQVNSSLNPHDDLDPSTSAQIIIRHVTDGLMLARKYRLPSRIQDFIAEHHGTMIARYQYAKAIEAANGDENEVDEDQFRYPGPRPQSRETAILMLADGCEARMRAERPEDEEALHSLIKNVIENRITSGQLDDTDLTLRDLEEIATSFVTTLRGIYHPRIEYPNIEKATSPKIDTSPTIPAVSRKAADVPINPQTDSPS
jgi:putative nucleotidyltransferase with HDIG domain